MASCLNSRARTGKKSERFKGVATKVKQAVTIDHALDNLHGGGGGGGGSTGGSKSERVLAAMKLEADEALGNAAGCPTLRAAQPPAQCLCLAGLSCLSYRDGRRSFDTAKDTQRKDQITNVVLLVLFFDFLGPVLMMSNSSSIFGPLPVRFPLLSVGLVAAPRPPVRRGEGAGRRGPGA